MGMHGIIVRDIVQKPGRESDFLGTPFFCRLAAGIAATALAMSGTFFMTWASPSTRRFILLASCTLPFASLSIVNAWFQAKVMPGPIVLARSTVFMASTAA